METNDYLKRHFDQLAKVLAHIIGLKKIKKHGEAVEFLDEALLAYYDFDIENIAKLSPEEAYDFLKQKFENIEIFECITELIYEKGLIQLQAGKKDESDYYFKLSCYLFKHLNTVSKIINMDRELKRLYLEKFFLN